MQIEIPDDLVAQAQEIAAKTGQDVQSLVTEMVTEAIKMRRVPGILFSDGATGRRARIGGTGIEVFEVVQPYEDGGRNLDELRRLFDWLDDYQIDMALAYYRAYPDDVAKHLKTEEQLQAELEELWKKYPQTSPNWPGRIRQASDAALTASTE
jgi:uncharacterized protein (DUF433 family)